MTGVGIGTSNANTAYTQVYNWMVGSTFGSCTTSGSNNQIYTCTLTLQNGTSAEAIWDTSQSCSNGKCTYSSVNIGSGWANYLDLSGGTNPISAGTVSVNVGIQPILLEK